MEKYKNEPKAHAKVVITPAHLIMQANLVISVLASIIEQLPDPVLIEAEPLQANRILSSAQVSISHSE